MKKQPLGLPSLMHWPNELPELRTPLCKCLSLLGSEAMFIRSLWVSRRNRGRLASLIGCKISTDVSSH